MLAMLKQISATSSELVDIGCMCGMLCYSEIFKHQSSSLLPQCQVEWMGGKVSWLLFVIIACSNCFFPFGGSGRSVNTAGNFLMASNYGGGIKRYVFVPHL